MPFGSCCCLLLAGLDVVIRIPVCLRAAFSRFVLPCSVTGSCPARAVLHTCQTVDSKIDSNSNRMTLFDFAAHRLVRPRGFQQHDSKYMLSLPKIAP